MNVHNRAEYVQALRGAIDGYAAEVVDAEAAHKDAERALNETRERLKNAQGLLQYEIDRDGRQAPLAPATTGPFTEMALRDAVLKVLADEVRGLSLDKVVERLISGGFDFVKPHPGRSVHAATLHTDQVVRLPDGELMLIEYKTKGMETVLNSPRRGH